MPPPLPRHMDSWQAAEANAVDWLRWFGYPDARGTGPGADGGVDVLADDALGQVKYRASGVGRPDLQRLFGARGSRLHQALFFFTGGDYSPQALAYADAERIALFQYSLTGAMTPVNYTARRVVAGAAERDAVAPRAREAATADRSPAAFTIKDADWATQEANLRAIQSPAAARRAEAVRATREAAREAEWADQARQASLRAAARRAADS